MNHPPFVLVTDQEYDIKIFKLTESSNYQNKPTYENKEEDLRIYFNQDNQRIISQEEDVKYVLHQNQTWESYPGKEAVQLNIQDIQCNDTVKGLQLKGFIRVKSGSTLQQCVRKALQHFQSRNMPTDQKIFFSKHNSKCKFSLDGDNDLVLEKVKGAEFFMFCPSGELM